MYSTFYILLFSFIICVVLIKGMIPLLFSDDETRTKPVNVIKLIIYTLIVILLGIITLSIMINNIFDFFVAIYGGIK